MRSINLTDAAKRDLDGIWLYIAENNFDAAGRVQDQIMAEIQKIAEHPGMGHRRDDLPNPNHRVWTLYSYLIIYDHDDNELRVLRVIHGARNIGSLLR